MILHIPHSSDNLLGRNIPLKDRLLLTDWFTDELFHYQNADCLKSEVSRFVVDMERFTDDKEPMFEKGFGICYTKTLDGKDIEVIDKDSLLELYIKHHIELNKITRTQLGYLRTTIIVDCHSYDESLVDDNPDFCIGFNEYKPYIEELKDYIIGQGYTCKFNTPYQGAIVPSDFVGDDRVHSVMIEVNKKLYMAIVDDTPVKNQQFDIIKTLVTNLLDIIAQTENKQNDFCDGF